MSEPDPSARRIEALERRISSLSAAILRIGTSLDVATVLQEAVDGACALTGTRYGFVVTVNDDFTIREIVSCGLTDDQHRRFTEWADGPKTFERLRGLSGYPRRSPTCRPSCARSASRPS